MSSSYIGVTLFFFGIWAEPGLWDLVTGRLPAKDRKNRLLVSAVKTAMIVAMAVIADLTPSTWGTGDEFWKEHGRRVASITLLVEVMIGAAAVLVQRRRVALKLL